jgi:Rieske Fe-S protein
MAMAAAGALIATGFGVKRAVAAPLAFVEALSEGDDGVTYEIPKEDGATIDRDKKVILVRWEQKIYAFALTCPHQNTALRWLEKDKRFQCPKHESKYKPDGTFISGRATRGMDRYPVKRDSDRIVVDVGAMKKETEDKAGWGAAFVSLS